MEFSLFQVEHYYNHELIGPQLLNLPTNIQTTRPLPNPAWMIKTHHPDESV